MTRLAGITAAYALIAALVLVAPLSASDGPAPEGAPTENAGTAAAAAPEDARSGSAAPQDAAPDAVARQDAAPESAAPQDAAPKSVAPQDAAPTDAPPAAEPPAATSPAGTAPEADPVVPPADPAASAPTASPEPASSAPAPGAPAAAASDEPGERGSRDRSGPRAKAAANASVTISDFQFAPASVTVDAGDTVTWTNDGPTPHSATADDGSFDTGIFEAGQSRSQTFEQAGTFSYFCTPHPNMRGTVTVRAASTGGSGGGSGGGSESTGGTTGESGTASAGTGGSSDSSGAELPATGLDAGGLIVLGLTTLALGAWLRRRAASAG
jgi:LPXTG-motif cell wall-anchored protein